MVLQASASWLTGGRRMDRHFALSDDGEWPPSSWNAASAAIKNRQGCVFVVQRRSSKMVCSPSIVRSTDRGRDAIVSRAQKAVVRSATCAVVLLLFLWPAIYNRQPLFSPDTGAYIR